jgi:predicted pyridoxine 5'-phosphate oxidase superfamily flavin-nucleotide-binding protein
MTYASDVAFTAAVKRAQTEHGSRSAYARLEAQRGGFAVAITDELATFIAERDSAFLATTNASGQPYVQHRGGRPGFLRVLDEQTVAFADFVGNKQYITTGNLAENDRAFLFLIDYERRERMKLWGRAKVVVDDAALLAKLIDADYGARVEQAVVFTVEAWDANCPQHIPRLVHADEADAAIRRLQERVAFLERTLRTANVAFT